MIHLKLYDSRCTKKEYIESVIEICKQIFNETLGQNFFKDNNLKVAFCNSENSAAVYEEFCKQFFPLYLGEGYSRTTYTAQAFTNEIDGVYGILVCLDTGPESGEWYQIILHEMSHIFKSAEKTLVQNIQKTIWAVSQSTGIFISDMQYGVNSSLITLHHKLTRSCGLQP